MLIKGQLICCKARSGNERGSTFVEVLVALVVLGIVVASVPPAIILSTKAVFAQKEQTIAENLSRNQIEYVKNCPYISGVDGPWDGDGYPDYDEVPVPDGSYKVTVRVRPLHVTPGSMLHTYLPPFEDEGIQEITVEIEHVDKLVLTTKCYKVER